MQITKSPMGSPIVTSPVILPTWDLPSGKVYQLTLIPGFEPVPAELMKMQGIRLYQNTHFSKIYIYPVDEAEDGESAAPALESAE